MKNLTKLSDKGLLARCKEYGEQAIRFRRKFIGLLPEVKKRKLFEKKKCKSIYEFAAKYGGISREHVDRVVNLSDRFAEKPLLHSLLVNGEISSNKLARIASIVDMIDETDLVEAVKKLACRTVETYVRDVKREFGVKDWCIGERNNCLAVGEENLLNFGDNISTDIFGINSSPANLGGEVNFNSDEKSSKIKIENGSLEPLNDPKSVHVHRPCVEDNTAISQIEIGSKVGEYHEKEALPLKKLQLKLSQETLENLLELQERGVSVDKLFREFLQKREENLTENKVKVAAKEVAKEEKRRVEGKKANRRLSVGVKKVLKDEFGDRCSVSGCLRESVHIHHKVPFSISGSNDPRLLAPLCREHHDIVHSINVKYLEKKMR
ncbi:MAG: HNH endonuclease signature motif containing protein [Candidatus Peregrinibacteria bacterium]|nr:HNH endonuclease signature motif containing protein [Candidatus Peregrinibacteria bacterium]MDZ4245338.1 HNH endonuclease signature motif containing protein [Candidatus Gracilibacteria bacterium]